MPSTPAGCSEQRSVTVTVPAKINLGLSVGARRPDGFHELRTIFHAVGLHDTVRASHAADLELRLSGAESTGLPADERNLAWQAARLIAEHAGRAADVRLDVDKQIPVAAGLAGGSADAAATLVACDRLWQLRLPKTELAGLAGRLGSDVSFALHGRTALGTGRGEELTGLAAAAELHWVLAIADGGLSTPAVYAEFDRQPPSRPVDIEPLLAALAAADADRLAPLLGNDLEPAAIALAPYLRETLAAGRTAGALAGLVSGSGPTCAFLAADAGHARLLATALQDGRSCRLALAVPGGVPGASVLDQPSDELTAST
ncbi:MAG: 4-(cytidine 5'-diphospho)-2-C-methyl-D-erythritol kinase [Actinomycetota bacterium]|nr:4-(cytidine 5'-diphospho)-2-C-methyl-D-erythritol kinase [Actinomycetota bacterium]MDQ2958533.1 4-(cytidine 5'-diphospho)-2-C-methyl-D-erythritol kinase [Actinomycetota bacterium]